MQSQPDPNKPQKSRPPIPETVGATSAPFELGKRTTTISFDIHVPVGPALSRQERPAKRILLRVENVKSAMLAPSFRVYLNVPPGEEPEKHPDLRAFNLSTFGMVEASESKGHHPGDGLSFLKDVTELLVRLTITGDWDGRSLRVSFVPAPWGDYPISVQVGRVSLMLE